MGLLTSQPGKALWTLFAVAFTAARLPLWIVYYISPSLRQHPHWSFTQALRVKIVSVFLWHASVVQVKTPLSLAPGAEKERWAVAKAAPRTTYMGVANSDPDIEPASVGGTWYPAKPSATARPSYVVLHFHGGAYVIGDGRSKDAGFAAKTLIKNTEASHVFAPQYRLSSNTGGRFPSQLQDAITAYHYLVNEENIAPQKIIISGDSAGANLGLSLVRYLAEHGTTVGLAGPLCAWLWSPWVNPVASLTTEAFDSSPHAKTDYVNGMFGMWGAKTLQPSSKTGLTLSSGYISFSDNAFATETPLYISAGECEALYHDCVDLYEQMKAIKGNRVELQIEEHSVHDTILAGPLLGFEKEAGQAAKRAGDYLRTLTSSS